jgi:small GTP-binding protein
VVLVGDTGVGKTSIAHSFVRGEFEPDQRPTVGGVFHTIARDVRGRLVTMQLWDTAGQEKFRSIGPIYYRNAAAAVAVFDLQNKNFAPSLDSWIINVRRNCTDPRIYVVGNKADLVGTDDESMLQRVKDFADRHSAMFFLVSAKSGSNINLLFENVFKGLYESTVGQSDVCEVGEAVAEKTGAREPLCC